VANYHNRQPLPRTTTGWEEIERRPKHGSSEDGQHRAQQEANYFLQELSNMLDSKEFGFAVDTLEGIYETVEKNGFVSAGQQRAVNNIRTSRGWDEL
jgi:hypothetical protein